MDAEIIPNGRSGVHMDSRKWNERTRTDGISPMHAQMDVLFSDNKASAIQLAEDELKK